MKKIILRFSFICMIGSFLSAAEGSSQGGQSWFAWLRSFVYPSTISTEVSSSSLRQNNDIGTSLETSNAEKAEERRQLLERYLVNRIVTNDNVRMLESMVVGAITAEQLEALFDVIYKDGNKPSLNVIFSESFGGEWSNGQPQERFLSILNKKYQELRFPDHMAYVLNYFSNVHMRDVWKSVFDLDEYYKKYLDSDQGKTLTQRQLSELRNAYEHRRLTIVDPNAAKKEDEEIARMREIYQKNEFERLKKIIAEREAQAEREAKSK